ncbi:SMC-Scp complex subunit ScpB [Archangium minus]|uniref:SMC-Scp complex subunit ScpB n=1 Tax=Archangium minus TaxID=83450 RepID=A0ABY9WWL8_9BACT|nr:SMC-Scp complex subunit ScpB [Archangium violaceum]WNG47533.1 SMC-Scp complex subunit ScpB [Archangium minus]
MTTGNNGPEDTGPKTPRGSGGPSPFTEEEIAAVTGPGDEDELEDSDVATIEADEAPDLQTSFEKLVQKSRNLSPERVRTIVESVLFVADKPLDLDQLFEATGIDREKIQEALNQISGVHRDGISGMVLYEVAGGWQFRTDPHSAEYVRRYLRVKPQRLTRAAVETLAIIAYRQPVTRPEVEDIRGVDCGAVIKALLDRKLIKILGKKEEVGRPMLYGTTREFLEFFALKDLSALPTLREFHELTQEHQEIVEKERPAAPSASGTVETLADPEFQKRMEKSVAASEAALEELEQAMDAAEKTQKVANSILNPTPPPSEGDKGPEPA